MPFLMDIGIAMSLIDKQCSPWLAGLVMRSLVSISEAREGTSSVGLPKDFAL